jgi:hypothetical protein
VSDVSNEPVLPIPDGPDDPDVLNKIRQVRRANRAYEMSLQNTMRRRTEMLQAHDDLKNVGPREPDLDELVEDLYLVLQTVVTSRTAFPRLVTMLAMEKLTPTQVGYIKWGVNAVSDIKERENAMKDPALTLEQAEKAAARAKERLHDAQTGDRDTQEWSDAAKANTKAREDLTRARAQVAADR